MMPDIDPDSGRSFINVRCQPTMPGPPTIARGASSLADTCFAASSHAGGALMFFLSRPLDVLDHSPQLFPELLVVVIDAVHVSARTRHALNDPAGLFDVLIAHPVQRKLRRVEGHSVGTMGSRSRPECDQGLIACRKRGVASYPIERVGVLLQYGFWHLAQEVGNETEVLLEVVEDLLPSHGSPPFPRHPYD